MKQAMVQSVPGTQWILRMRIDCPHCGKMILRTADTSDAETECPKCNARFGFSVRNGQIALNVITWPETQTKTATATSA